MPATARPAPTRRTASRAGRPTCTRRWCVVPQAAVLLLLLRPCRCGGPLHFRSHKELLIIQLAILIVIKRVNHLPQLSFWHLGSESLQRLHKLIQGDRAGVVAIDGLEDGHCIRQLLAIELPVPTFWHQRARRDGLGRQAQHAHDIITRRLRPILCPRPLVLIFLRLGERSLLLLVLISLFLCPPRIRRCPGLV